MYLNLILEGADTFSIVLAVVLTSIILLFVIVSVVLFLAKRLKKAKKGDINKEQLNSDLVEAFGKGNIKAVEVEMSRITVTVSDVEIVNTERIKELGASGILLVGNKVKCSFKEDVTSKYSELKGAISNE